MSSFCIVLLLQLQFVFSYWCRGCVSSGPIYYVPPSAPPEYIRVVQGYPSENSRQCQPLEVPSSGFQSLSGVSSPFGIVGVPPAQDFPAGDPELYEGQYQAAAVAVAHPNQPVIIINNGDYATKKENGGLFGGDGGDLLALLIRHHEHGPPEPQPPPPAYNSGETNTTGPINLNITIIISKTEPDCCKNKDEDD